MSASATNSRVGGRLPAALAAALLAACGPSEPGSEPAARQAGDRPEAAARPDVVVVVIDTLRADALPLYGYDGDTAPFLSGLAEDSVVFDRAYSSSSYTAPSTSTVLTGLYPPRHGVTHGLHADFETFKELKRALRRGAEYSKLPPSVPTLAELMREGGYATFGVAGNINLREERGFARGYDRFFMRPDGKADELVERVLEWRAEMFVRRPFFLYAHFNDVHFPYLAHAPWYRASDDDLTDARSRYDSEIRFLDGQLARLWEELELSDDAVTILVSDHGEEFGDHGGRGHGWSLHTELNRVAMIVHAPGVSPGARRVDAPVSLIDVLPSALDFAGISAQRTWDGRSVAPIVRGADRAEQPFRERTLFAHRVAALEGHELWAAIDGRWKLIEDRRNGTTELFDLLADFGEQRDLAAEHPEKVAELGRSLKAFQAWAQPVEEASASVAFDEETIEMLRELGYAGDDPGGLPGD